MSGDTVREVATVRGVRAAAAQFFLASVPVPDPSSSDAFDALLVAFDPETDLTIKPWLTGRGQHLGANEVIAGADISSPSGHIEVFGSDLVLKVNLTRTGTDLDRALFVSTETARTLAQGETAALAGPLSEGAATTILVKVDRDADAHEVALQIIQDVPGVSPIEAPGLFRSLRAEMRGLIDVSVVVLVSAWLLSVVIVGLIFAVSANERRREVTVLRALGCSRPFVFRLLLTEASLLSLAGALFGVALVAPTAYVWREQIAGTLEIPFFAPSAMWLLELAGAGIALTIVSVAAAAAVPAARLGLEDSTIRE
jgi:putative ABC transport system permease protein